MPHCFSKLHRPQTKSRALKEATWKESEKTQVHSEDTYLDAAEELQRKMEDNLTQNVSSNW